MDWREECVGELFHLSRKYVLISRDKGGLRLFTEIVLLMGSVFFIFVGYRFVKSQPDLFKGETILKASKTLAVLAVGLMALVVGSIVLLRGL